MEEQYQQHLSEKEKLIDEHKDALEKVELETEGGQIKLREEMTAQALKASKTMQTALSAITLDKDQLVIKANESTLTSVHATLEGLLRDTFNIEDGARLSSLQSYQAGQTPLAALLDEFRQLMEQLDLQKKDSSVLTALDKLWQEAFERFSPTTTLMHFAKKARQDTATWMQQRLNLSQDQRDKN